MLTLCIPSFCDLHAVFFLAIYLSDLYTPAHATVACMFIIVCRLSTCVRDSAFKSNVERSPAILLAQVIADFHSLRKRHLFCHLISLWLLLHSPETCLLYAAFYSLWFLMCSRDDLAEISIEKCIKHFLMTEAFYNDLLRSAGPIVNFARFGTSFVIDKKGIRRISTTLPDNYDPTKESKYSVCLNLFPVIHQ